MLNIEQVTKKFYSFTALDRVSLPIPAGEILGVLGPNGAGKTTLFKVLTGTLRPDGGAIHPAGSHWPQVGYKPERLFFPENMKIMQYLELMAELSNLPRAQKRQKVYEVLAQVRLTEMAYKRIGQCSKGMRQRVGLAQALLGDPQLLILDELTDGLDPTGQAEIEQCLLDLQKQGKTIVMSSHRLGEITAVCTRLVILNHGRVIYQNSMEEAMAERPKATIHVDQDLEPMRALLQTLSPNLVINGRELRLSQDVSHVRRQILSLLLSAGYDIVQIERRRATLSEIYAEVTR